jgi:hypothetical protein
MDLKEVADAAAKMPASTANTATGAASSVIELATGPAKTARRLEKKGRSVNRKVASQAGQAGQQIARPAAAILDGTLPERWLIAGVRLVKRQARRRDLVGLVAHRGISTVHSGLQVAVRSLSRFERATQPPARPGSSPSTRAAVKATAPRPKRAASRRRPAGTRSRTRTTT